MRLVAIDEFDCYLNGVLLSQDTTRTDAWQQAKRLNVLGKLREGKNVIALYVKNTLNMGYGVFPYLHYIAAGYEYMAQLPDSLSPMDPKLVAENTYAFPVIKNFQEVKQAMPHISGRNDDRKK